MNCITRGRIAVAELIDRLMYVIENNWKIKSLLVAAVILALTIFGIKSLVDEHEQIKQARATCEKTQQAVDALPDSPQSKVANRLTGLARMRLASVQDARDPLFKGLFEAAQNWITRAEKAGSISKVISSIPKNQDRELILLQEVQLQIAALPQDLPEAVEADKLLSRAERRLISLPHHSDLSAYADKEVQDLYASARQWAEAGSKKSQALSVAP